MEYTVKKVAELSGVSVRTLHFYHEVGLLKPAYVGTNGYRFYNQEQLLALQQILFYRELGFDLKQIRRVMARRDFDKIAALQSHRKVLEKKLAKTSELLVTIDNTIAHLKGRKKMQNKELFAGFSPEQQARHEDYLINRFGEGMKTSITESKQNVKNWLKSDWQKAGGAFEAICQDMLELMRKGKTAESIEVQDVIRRHHAWLQHFWTPTAKSYAGHSHLIVDSDLRKPYEAYHPQFPEFAAAAIRVFAENELD